VCALAAACALLASVPAGSASDRGLTAVPGIRVGHFTMAERPTGCTVILADGGAVGGVDVRGSAPGTRETELLHPTNLVDSVNAILLAGGSAFGLDAATGVVRYLDEKQIGFPTGFGPVPIVPAAILFDLNVGGSPKIRPTADCGYNAARAATDGPVAMGSIGAGAGATVGKLLGPDRCMKSGIGSASITMSNGLTIAALVAVNAFGDVIDPTTGRVIAGVRTEDGKGFSDARRLLREGAALQPKIGENTTLGVVATNARLTKAEASKVAQMAHDGLARVISPIHTMYDGDTVFTLSTGSRKDPVEVTLVGALAADVMAEAVLRAIREATGLPGMPAARDLPPGR
jgi:L-aminopeptidase/D-esterase-like protein